MSVVRRCIVVALLVAVGVLLALPAVLLPCRWPLAQDQSQDQEPGSAPAPDFSAGP